MLAIKLGVLVRAGETCRWKLLQEIRIILWLGIQEIEFPGFRTNAMMQNQRAVTKLTAFRPLHLIGRGMDQLLEMPE